MLSLEIVNDTVSHCLSSECTWTDRDYALAAWGFRKWKYHQFTSLRVGLVANTSMYLYFGKINSVIHLVLGFIVSQEKICNEDIK